MAVQVARPVVPLADAGLWRFNWDHGWEWSLSATLLVKPQTLAIANMLPALYRE